MSGALEFAKNQYLSLGVDVDAALQRLSTIRVSMHCWQGDDVQGFEQSSVPLGDGLAVTGNYPGRARNIQDLRQDIEFAFKLIPGKHKVNLHAIYGEFPTRVDRNEIDSSHFRGWIDWARSLHLGLDFNPTCFSHPKSADGYTLSHRDHGIRTFWIEHCKRSRVIAADMGRALGIVCVNNIWIPDGSKDTPADRFKPRIRLEQSLDEIFHETLFPEALRDAVEPKLFGIGSESFVVGSHEFYLGYAATRQKLLCLDAGHYHPTETLADKISSTLLFVPEILLHLSRGVRWDSDHVVTCTDEMFSAMREVVFQEQLQNVHIGLDYFDASINRVAAWVIGMRNVLKGLLVALLEPAEIYQAELRGDLTARLAIQEQAKALPWGIIWNDYCRRNDVAEDSVWLKEIQGYERRVLSNRH